MPQAAVGSTALTGGADAVAASKIIQDLTFTAVAAGVGGNAITIAYTGGATAGSEVVSVISNAISVQIEDGVSDADQVKAAYDAESDATDLATNVVSGTGGTPQVVVGATNLESGADAIASTKAIQNLNYLADTPGVAGNSITLTYTDDGTAGAETVDVVSTDIEVHMEGGVSTAAQIKTALDGSGPASALLGVAVDAGADTPQDIVGATNLAGGTDLVASSLVVQDITYTAVTAGAAGNSITMTYTAGGTAGSEVVSVAGTDIDIVIEDGVSTATEVKAAFDAKAEAIALATSAISGTAGTAQVAAVSAPFTSGTDLVAATKDIQNLTYEAALAGAAGNSITVAYTSGATAGAEVMTIVDNAFSVQIEDGVSNPVQIKAAIDAELIDDVDMDAGEDTIQDAQAETALAGGSSTQTYNKADILKIRRLRTKKYLVKLNASANPA